MGFLEVHDLTFQTTLGFFVCFLQRLSVISWKEKNILTSLVWLDSSLQEFCFWIDLHILHHVAWKKMLHYSGKQRMDFLQTGTFAGEYDLAVGRSQQQGSVRTGLSDWFRKWSCDCRCLFPAGNRAADGTAPVCWAESSDSWWAPLCWALLVGTETCSRMALPAFLESF